MTNGLWTPLHANALQRASEKSSGNDVVEWSSFCDYRMIIPADDPDGLRLQLPGEIGLFPDDAERSFSSGRDMITYRRSQLGGDIIEACVFLRSVYGPPVKIRGDGTTMAAFDDEEKVANYFEEQQQQQESFQQSFVGPIYRAYSHSINRFNNTSNNTNNTTMLAWHGIYPQTQPCQTNKLTGFDGCRLAVSKYKGAACVAICTPVLLASVELRKPREDASLLKCGISPVKAFRLEV
ncbi:unnamed protein product [Zymoseptoria tritici ST99CH_1A5]|uniref:Uncharacterized protein n=1 Tax=Zymoseptoria tritici ST99CH_1A5 TaxID=1276529 RepID=A0A1Y6LF54_ZYMTR|nr:unnamed protein product [Zymoseptoria tritici ST99CH_1A5]